MLNTKSPHNLTKKKRPNQRIAQAIEQSRNFSPVSPGGTGEGSKESQRLTHTQHHANGHGKRKVIDTFLLFVCFARRFLNEEKDSTEKICYRARWPERESEKETSTVESGCGILYEGKGQNLTCRWSSLGPAGTAIPFRLRLLFFHFAKRTCRLVRAPATPPCGLPRSWA